MITWKCRYERECPLRRGFSCNNIPTERCLTYIEEQDELIRLQREREFEEEALRERAEHTKRMCGYDKKEPPHRLEIPKKEIKFCENWEA
jgi:hypothetical protein